MRSRFFFLGISTSIVLGATAFLACGGGETVSEPIDSGADVVDAGPKDTGPDAQDSATCDLSADFTTKIPDASIADGATTSGICMGCVNTNCRKEVAACNHDCSCQNLANNALECYIKTQKLSCAASFAGAGSSTQKLGIALFGCVNDSCQTECAVNSFIQDAGSDG